MATGGFGSGRGMMTELGESGLRRAGGMVLEEDLPRLQGRWGIQQYKEMSANDAIVGAILRAVDTFIRGMDWHTEPGGTSNEDMRTADFIDEIREDMSHSWADLMSEVMTMLSFGWSYFEIVLKRRQGDNRRPGLSSRYNDGRIGVRKLASRSQDSLERWIFDDEGGVAGMVQQQVQNLGSVSIPIEKSLLFRTVTRKGNPEGQSVLRNAWRSWRLKKRLEEIEGIGYERDLTGLPVAFVPPTILMSDASPQEVAIKNQLKKIVTGIRKDEQSGILFPQQYDHNGNLMYELKLLSTENNAGKNDPDTAIERYSRQIAMTVLADVILIGHQKTGSYALADSKTHLFSSSLGALADVAEAVFNRHLIPRLLRLNGLPTENPPQWKHGDVETMDLDELGKYIERLSKAGFPLFPTESGELERRLLQQASLPEPAEGEDFPELPNLMVDPMDPNGDDDEKDPKGRGNRGNGDDD